MFSSTVRRAASSAPQTSIANAISSATPRAIVSQALSYQCHQRRFSSSKPSSPADGSKGVAERQAVPAAPTKARSKAKASKVKADGEQKSPTSSKKAKDVAASSTVKGRDESMLHLPSVPSTQHVTPLRKFGPYSFLQALTGFPCRNLRLCLFLPLPTHIHHEQLPQSSDR